MVIVHTMVIVHIYIWTMCYLNLLFHAATLRNGAFKLKPIKMSTDLIDQLNAVAVKLEEFATALQDLIAKKKSKTKHYLGIITEATFVMGYWIQY